MNILYGEPPPESGGSRKILAAIRGGNADGFVRCRSLQGGSWPGLDGEALDRDDLPGLCPPPQGTPIRSKISDSRSKALTLDLVLAKFVPVQAAQEGCPGSYGDSHQAVKRPPSVPRPSPPALGQIARYQPHNTHSPCFWLPERRQELFCALSDAGRYTG